MATNVTMPQLGESVTEGTVTRWLKNVGDTVKVDEAIVEVSTDKVDTEIPSPVAGILLEIKTAQDAVVPVGSVMAVIGDSNSAASSAPSAPVAPKVETPKPAPTPKVEPVVVKEEVKPVASTVTQILKTEEPVNKDFYATPIVRQLAKEKGIDLTFVKGSGTNGRITREDVLAATTKASPSAQSTQTFAPSTPPVTTPATPSTSSPKIAEPAKTTSTSVSAPNSTLRGKVEQTSRLRRIIAERMVQSLHISAQLTSVVEVDVTKIASLRNKVKDSFAAREGVKLSFLPFFAKVTIDTLKEYPILNATISEDATQITYSDAQHLAVAVDTPRGLLVPVIRDAGDLSIAGLARKIQDVANRTRDNKVTPDELSGGTFTLTNTGSRGALFDTPIINQPQVGILGTGAVVKRPVVVKGEDGTDQIAIRQMVYLALTYDHRLVDGADAARFLSSMKVRLEEANFESELGL